MTGEASRAMRTGLTISGAGHAVVLLWSVLTLTLRPYHTESMTAVPIDVISTSDFSQLTAGTPTAKPAERWSVGHRIRDVEVGPDGALWMLEDSATGGLFKVTPTK